MPGRRGVMEGCGLGFGAWITAVGRGLALGVRSARSAALAASVRVCMCSLWIVNQVLVRFGRAGRLGGFCLGAQALG